MKYKIIFAIICGLFYIPAYLLLKDEIGNANYSLPTIVLGSFFALFGLFCHSVIFFPLLYEKLQGNNKLMHRLKYFGKIFLSTVITLIGSAILYSNINDKSDNIRANDLTYFKGTLRLKPEFRRGSKSSTYLNIYLKELPEIVFEPMYANYLHFNTSIELLSSIGDTVVLGILTNDYEKDITKVKAKSYSEKHLKNRGKIMAYYIARNEDVFYSPSIHNMLDEKDSEYGFIIWIMGLIFLLGNVSIWLPELVVLMKKKGYIKIAEKLMSYRKRKIF